jgi:hypothetical protein
MSGIKIEEYLLSMKKERSERKSASELLVYSGS